MRPKIEIPLNENDKKLELFGIILILFIVLFSAYAYWILPETIPVHFNFKGEVDDWGSKIMILFLPLVGLLMYFGLGFLNKKPHLFNFPIEITEANALEKYTIATKMMRILKLELLVIFSLIELFTFFSVRGNISSLIFWFLPFVIILVFGTLIYFIKKLYKKTSN